MLTKYLKWISLSYKVGRLKIYCAKSFEKIDYRFRFASAISQTSSYGISNSWSDRKPEYILFWIFLRRRILKGLRSLEGECGRWIMGFLIPLLAVLLLLHAWIWVISDIFPYLFKFLNLPSLDRLINHFMLATLNIHIPFHLLICSNTFRIATTLVLPFSFVWTSIFALFAGFNTL